MSDLEWLATHLGWTGVQVVDGEVCGFPPYEPNDKHTEEQWYAYGPGNYMDVVPLYDQSIDLMVELVQAMSLCDRENWTEILVELVMQKTEIHDYFDYINAPASLRLKAYRQVMEGDNTQCL